MIPEEVRNHEKAMTHIILYAIENYFAANPLEEVEQEAFIALNSLRKVVACLITTEYTNKARPYTEKFCKSLLNCIDDCVKYYKELKQQEQQ
jgi:hypothetical protein